MIDENEDIFTNDLMSALKQTVFKKLDEKHNGFKKEDDINEDDGRSIMIALCAAAAQLAKQFDRNEEYFLTLAQAVWADVVAEEENNYSIN